MKRDPRSMINERVDSKRPPITFICGIATVPTHMVLGSRKIPGLIIGDMHIGDTRVSRTGSEVKGLQPANAHTGKST